MVAGSQVTPPAGLTFTTQAMYNVLNDGSITLTVTTANATNPRIDAVYVGVQDAFYSGASNAAVAGIVAGIPASSPVAPSIPVNSLLLGYIAVGAGVTSIVTANISAGASLAVLLGGGDSGWVTPTLINGWSVSTLAVQYRRLNGVVYLRGRATGGTSNTAFTLPGGFRPNQAGIFAVHEGVVTSGESRVVVGSDGTVQLTAGQNPNLNTVIFPADQ